MGLQAMKPDVDHGWSWLVLAGGCLMTTISEAYRQTSGIFYSEFMDTMNLSRTEAAIIIAVLNSMFMIPGPLVSYLASRFGTRTTIVFGTFITSLGLLGASFSYSFWLLLFNFGGLLGFGMCLTFVPMFGGLPVWFLKYRQLAPSACMSFGAIGTFIFAPIIQFLVDEYTWRGCVIIMAGIYLNIAVTGAVFLPVRPSPGPTTGNLANGGPSAKQVLMRSLSFWLHLLNGFLMFGIPIYLIFLVRHVTKHRGFSPQEAAVLVSICGGTGLLGRVTVVCSSLIQRTNTRNTRFLVYNLASLFGGVASGLIPIFWDFYAISVICGIMGYMQGLKLASMFGVTLDITTVKYYQTGYGIHHCVCGLSVLLAIPFAGLLAEIYQSYDACFYLSAGALFLSFLLGSFVHYLEARKTRKRVVFRVPG